VRLGETVRIPPTWTAYRMKDQHRIQNRLSHIVKCIIGIQNRLSRIVKVISEIKERCRFHPNHQRDGRSIIEHRQVHPDVEGCIERTDKADPEMLTAMRDIDFAIPLMRKVMVTLCFPSR
jgi:hypothetical protein